MLYKIYHPFVYGIHVTRSWHRLTLSLDRISSNFQYSMTARSKELIIKIHGDNSKVFHCEVELSTRNVTAGKSALPNTPSRCCLSGLFRTQLRYEATKLPDGFKMFRHDFCTEKEISIM